MNKTALWVMILFSIAVGVLVAGCAPPPPGHGGYSVYTGFHGGPAPGGGPGLHGGHRARPSAPAHMGRPSHGGGGGAGGGGMGRPPGGGGRGHR